MNKWDKIRKKDLKSLGEAPVEVSPNLQAPELAPKDNRFTGRTKRIAFTCRPEFAEELRKMAFEKNCYQIEILEKAIEVYKKNLLSDSETKKSEAKPKENNNVSQKINKIPANNYQEEDLPDLCSFFLSDEKTKQIITCDKPLFNWKKRLCRSHNQQVRKRFNGFTKDMSISSTAAWEMQWEQSGDWRHFWNLVDKDGKKQEKFK